MKRILKIIKNNTFGFILGMIVASTLTVYAATTLASSSVSYSNSSSGGSSTNVQGALDELYDMAENHCPDGHNCYKRDYIIGTEITLAGEVFNVISETENTVTMLAQYNLGTDYRQSTTENKVKFSDTYGWEYEPGPKEIDIQIWSTNPKTYVNEYVSYLQGELSDTTITGNLITLAELKNLGCSIYDSYSSSGNTCNKSEYLSWLYNEQTWFIRSASSTSPYFVFYMWSGGAISTNNYKFASVGIRPIITISKSTLENL